MLKYTGKVINYFILLQNKNNTLSIALKKIKYVGVNLMKDMQEFYPGNCKQF